MPHRPCPDPNTLSKTTYFAKQGIKHPVAALAHGLEKAKLATIG
jgi:hypothetical protein